MARKPKLLYGALTLLGMAVVVAAPREQFSVTPKSSAEDFSLTTKDLYRHSSLAISGSISSGHCLALYYGFARDPNDPDSQYWIEIAAQNGDPDAMMLLAGILDQSGIARDKARATFWRDRAAKSQPIEDVKCTES